MMQGQGCRMMKDGRRGLSPAEEVVSEAKGGGEGIEP